jgi:phospholipid/cholesterol/gamma-HCH transport system permease protein
VGLGIELFGMTVPESASVAGVAAAPRCAFRVDAGRAGGPDRLVAVSGQLGFTDAAPLWNQLRAAVDGVSQGASVRLDVSGIEKIDGSCIALIVHVKRELEERGIDAAFVGAKGAVEELIHVFRGDVHVGPRKKRRPESALSQIGRATIDFFVSIQEVLGFFGVMVQSFFGVLRAPKTANWRELAPTMEKTGADAVVIVVIINFLVGFVMAYQGAVQLKQFGANIFVADLVGLSVCRELGPLMTAIVVCGRSGAAFTAELGSMKVSEEIDALRTMGFGTMRFLVLPRVLALVLVLPFLTLIADIIAMLGGLVVGLLSLDLTVVAYINETQKAVNLWDVGSGLIKSVVFAMAIGLIACQQGLATTGGAEGVGRRTTGAVVSILFALILIDAAFAVVFNLLGI